MSSLRQRSQRGQRGLSLVELMVGITVGLIVVAGASVLLSGQLVENRRLVAEAQVQQDLRSTADIITRELRRSGSIGVDDLLVQRIWLPGSINDVVINQHSEYLTPASGVGPVNNVGFDYDPTGPGTEGRFGFRLLSPAGVIQTFLVAGGWQDLTDPATIRVTQFGVTRLADTQVRIPCPKACPDTTSNCWPTVNLRTLELNITVQSRSQPEVVRSHRSRVRVRNDHVEYFNPVAPPNNLVCPA